MKRTTFKALTEVELARHQTLQRGNDCTLHAISAALALLTDQYFPPNMLIEQVNQLWWQGRFFRVAPGWAVTPRMQARFVNYLAKKYQLPVSAKLLHLSPEILPILPNSDQLLALITLFWLPGQAPAIYYGDQKTNSNETKTMGAHTMLFATYDPDHRSGEVTTPWGFINSWHSDSTSLYWMEDTQFTKAWNFHFPYLGNNPAVIISRT